MSSGLREVEMSEITVEKSFFLNLKYGLTSSQHGVLSIPSRSPTGLLLDMSIYGEDSVEDSSDRQIYPNEL